MSIITQAKYIKTKRMLITILEEYSFDYIKQKRLEYRRTRESSLKKFHNLCHKYYRYMKVINDYEEQSRTIVIEYDNCQRQQISNSNNNINSISTSKINNSVEDL